MKYLFFLLSAFFIQMVFSMNPASDKAIALPPELEQQLAQMNLSKEAFKIERIHHHLSEFAYNLKAKEPIKFMGTKLNKGVEIVFRDGKFRKIWQNYANIVMNGIICGSSVELKDNKICSCHAAEDQVIGDTKVSKHTAVVFEGEKVKYLRIKPTAAPVILKNDGTQDEIASDDFNIFSDCSRDIRPNIISCPDNLLKRNFGSNITECCSIDKSDETTCFREGPSREILRKLRTSDQKIRTEIHFSNNIKNGKYVEWLLPETKPRMLGQFKDDMPVGEWKFFDEASDLFYQIEYSNDGVLKSARIPKQGDKEESSLSFEPQQALKEIPQGRILGRVQRRESERHMSVNYSEFSSKMLNWGMLPIYFDHLVLYLDADKSKAIGITTGEYRFYSRDICTSDCDPIIRDGSAYWEIFEKKHAMCKAYLKGGGGTSLERKLTKVYPVWFECPDFKDIVDVFKEMGPGVASGVLLYAKPGMTDGSPITGKEEMDIEILDRKTLGSMPWLKVRIFQTNDETEQVEEKGTGWIPVYKENDQLNIIHAFKGC